MTKLDYIITIIALIIIIVFGYYIVKTTHNMSFLQKELILLKSESLALKANDSTLDQSFSTLNEQFWLKQQNERILEKKLNALKTSHDKVTQIRNTPAHLIDTTGILDSLTNFTN